MTCLARAGKCVGRVEGLVAADLAAAARTREAPPQSSDASAILPTPTPHSEKKWRRGGCRRSVAVRAWLWGSHRDMALLRGEGILPSHPPRERQKSKSGSSREREGATPSSR